jgi:predicted ribonuclease YlaK
MLTRPVLRELDKFKDDKTIAWRRNRARMLLSKMDELLPQSATGVPVPIKDGVVTVFLLDIPREPDAEWIRKHALDPEVGDDRILACVLRYREQYPDRHICFLSNDMSFRRNAIANGIDTMKPDGGELVQLEQRSPEEERVRELERELQDYKNSRPKLEMGFDNDRELTTMVTCPAQGDDAPTAEVLSKVFTDEYVHLQFIEQRQHLERIIDQSRGLCWLLEASAEKMKV